jgi:hypothetical protein
MSKKSRYLLIVICWASLCLAFFIVGPVRRSGIHLFPLEGQTLNTIVPQIAAINFPELLTNTLKAFTGSAVFALSAIGLGLFFIKIIDRQAETADEGGRILATAFMVGQSLFSFLFLFFLIAFQKFLPITSTIVFLMGLIFLFLRIHPYTHSISKKVRELSCFSQEREVNLLVIFSIIGFGCTLLYSSSRLSYDAASQYFTQAKMIALSERAILLSHKDIFAGSSIYQISLQSAIIQLFGDQAARMYSWMNGLAILSFGMIIGERVGISRRARFLFLPLVLTTTAFVDLLGDGKIDLANTALVLASVYWFLRSLQKPSRLFFFLAGLFGGLAIVARPYNAILLGVFFLLLILCYVWSAQERIVFIRSLIYASPGFFPPMLFWGVSYLIVNTVFIGDPFAPLSLLGLSKSGLPYYINGMKRIFLTVTYPIVVTYDGTFDSLGFISPFFLGFISLIFIKEVRTFRTLPRELIFVSISSLLTLYLWIIAFGSLFIYEVRYVLFLWMIIFLAMAQLLDNAMLASAFFKAGVQVVIITLLFVMTMRTIIISLATYSPIALDNFPQCHNLPNCTFFAPVNLIADPGDRVLVLSAYRYYLRPDLFACSSNKDDYLALEKAALQSPNKFWEEIHRQGYEYIIYDSLYNKYILHFQNLSDMLIPSPSNAKALYDRTFRDYDLRIITESVYQIEPSHSTFPKTSCVFINDHWYVQR